MTFNQAMAGNVPDVVSNLNTFSGNQGGMVILVSCLAVGAILFVWAAYFRKTPRDRKSFSRPQPDSEAPDRSGFLSRRRRRRRRDRRNPTLAETGGLPPMRPDGQPGLRG